MNTASFTGVAALLLYFAATLLVLWRLRAARTQRSLPLVAMSFAAVLLHAVCLWHATWADQGLRLGLFPMASLITGTGAALLTTIGLYRRLEWVGALVFPLCALSIPPLLWMNAGPATPSMPPGVGFHVLLSILASAMLAIATAHAMLIVVQHRALKHGRIRGVLRAFPPMAVMEKMLFQLLWAGFIFLSAAILTGFIYIDDMFAQKVAHKTVITLLAWLLFAVLLAGHHIAGWRGLTAVRWTLSGFALLLLAFFGSQLVLEYIL